MKLEFSRHIFEESSNIRPVRAVLLHADEQTGINLIVAFRNFAKAPKNTHNACVSSVFSI